MKAKRKKAARVEMVHGMSPIKSFTLEDIRAIVREEVRSALAIILEAQRRAQDKSLHPAWIELVLGKTGAFVPENGVTEYVVDVWHSCERESPPRNVDLEIGYQADGYLVSTAYAARRGDGRWYSIRDQEVMGQKLRDDLQRPSVWRRPLHQEQRAA